jgi:hypothetical protein
MSRAGQICHAKENNFKGIKRSVKKINRSCLDNSEIITLLKEKSQLILFEIQ